jgi:EAL and modified HD-GYP domain-containing signal transduction protein
MDVFVARQPIFDRFRRTYAYELLFRSGPDNRFDGPDPTRASLTVLDTVFNVLGNRRITGGKRVFVNFTRETLLAGFATMLPSAQLVVELLEDITPDREVLDACQALRRQGYLIALDDVAWATRSVPLLEVADVVKVDFMLNAPRERELIAAALLPLRVRLLAEKVATWADVAQALRAGYHYFQGYFFSEPEILAGKDVDASKRSRLQLLREINRPDTDLERLEQVIKHEVAFTLKLLTHLNTAAFGFAQRITSVQHALLLLGEGGVRKWASLVALSDLGRDKAFELVLGSVVRARFCEQLFGLAGMAGRAQDGFFLGLFSMLDALLDQPLAEIVPSLPIAEDVCRALLGDPNPIGHLYRLAVAYERGDWPVVLEVCPALGIDPAALPELHFQSVEWGHSTAVAEETGGPAR